MKARWATHRYAPGDLVFYRGRTWTIDRVELYRGPDRRPKPMYVLYRLYPPLASRGRTLRKTFACSSAKNLRKVA